MWPFDYFKNKSLPSDPKVGNILISAEDKAKREAETLEYDRIEKFYKDNPPGPALDKMVFDAVFSDPAPHIWTVPEFSTDSRYMMEVLARLAETRHVYARISVGDADEEHMDSEVTMWAGDCNCPHQQEYDPNDGHGSTYAMEIPGRTPMHAVALAAIEMCRRVKPISKLLDKVEVHG